MGNRIQRALGLLQFLYVQRIKGFAPPGDEPFMDPEGIARFKKEVSKARRYVEFGSGGSTVFADRLAIHVVSVENDRFYARAVASRLGGGSVRQIVIGMGITREWGFPLFPDAEKARAYVSAPWSAQAFPDFILVDGRYRVACALESARRAHEAGARATLMFDDYTLRPHYHRIEELLGAPETVGRAAIFRLGSQAVSPADVEPWLSDPS